MARIEKYLPALNNIVVKSKSASHVYHKTTKDVVVTGIKDDVCPLTGDSVQTGFAEKLQIWFNPLQIDTRVVLEESDVDAAMLNESLTILDYDVPSSGPTEGFSPAAALRRYAVPMTKSVWLVRSSNVPWNFIAEMRSMGVKIDTSKLDASETRRKVSRAVLFMIDQLNAKIAASLTTARNAGIKLDQAQANGVNPDDAIKTYKKSIAAVDHTLRKYIDDTNEGAKAFTLNVTAFGMPRLQDHAKAIRATMDERAEAYAQATRALADVDPVLATMAAQDQLHVAPMADALREAGKEEEADAVQKAFSETDDGTFSLV